MISGSFVKMFFFGFWGFGILGCWCELFNFWYFGSRGFLGVGLGGLLWGSYLFY